jgi:CubicO group peptidase (beta-lactamase class C family)
LEERLLRFLAEDVIAGAGFSAAVAALSRGGECLASAAAGWSDAERGTPTRMEDLFDLASLTKPWVATLAAVLDDDGSLPLGTRVGDVWEAAPRHLAGTSCADLLCHRSGLQPWAPLYLLCGDGRPWLDVLGEARLSGAPPGTYSDLGYLLWRAVAERVLARPLASLLTERVLSDWFAAPASEMRPAPAGERAVWCGLGTAKEVELARGLGYGVSDLGPPARGVAQDGNARFLGGLAGHAGLFGTVGALLRLGQAWLCPGSAPSLAAVERAMSGSNAFASGWWRAQPGGRAVLSPAAFGHPGFTGGSLWIDPKRDLVVAMLGHRQDPFSDLSPLRSELHRVAIAAVGG